MKKMLLAVILGFGILLPSHAQTPIKTYPAAVGCLQATISGATITVTNVCSDTIQAKLRFSDGSNDYDTDFTPGYSYSVNRPGARIKTFGCRNGAVPTASPTSFQEPTYYTTQYWCI